MFNYPNCSETALGLNTLIMGGPVGHKINKNVLKN